MSDPSSIWHRFLTALDPDPRVAASKYHELREQLMETFRRHGLSATADLADEAIDRAVRHLARGHVRHVPAFVLGVARRLVLERRRAATRLVPLRDDGLPSRDDPHDEPAAHRLAQLERLLGELPAETRALVLAYHAHDDHDRTRRARLAEGLGTGLNALRIRMHRLRRELRTSIERAA